MARGRFRGDRRGRGEARRRSGLSQAELATAIGAAGRERGSQRERGIEHPHPRQLLAVAEVLGIDPLELLGVAVEEWTLRDIRLAAGLSLTDAHRAAGLPYSTYYRLEGGFGVAPRAPARRHQHRRGAGGQPGRGPYRIERARWERRADPSATCRTGGRWWTDARATASRAGLARRRPGSACDCRRWPGQLWRAMLLTAPAARAAMPDWASIGVVVIPL